VPVGVHSFSVRHLGIVSSPTLLTSDWLYDFRLMNFNALLRSYRDLGLFQVQGSQRKVAWAQLIKVCLSVCLSAHLCLHLYVLFQFSRHQRFFEDQNIKTCPTRKPESIDFDPTCWSFRHFVYFWIQHEANQGKPSVRNFRMATEVLGIVGQGSFHGGYGGM
jgi:hypothetical protein